jgi:diguanylate cyclase (GGDEF)-like protein
MTNGEGLEEILDQYSNSEKVGFGHLLRWESELNNPFDLIRLYDRIVMDHTLQGEGATSKELEAGILGYIKGRKIVATNNGENLASTDSLTDLPNLRGYQSMIEGVVSRANREKREFALVFIDINNFKPETNDKYGHKFGDDVIRYVGEALVEHTRTSDGKARLSGDEFVIILETNAGTDYSKTLESLTNKINDYVHRQIAVQHPNRDSNVSVSLGMAIFNKDSKDADALISHADDAMYYAKTHPIGGQKLTFHVYDPSITYVKKEERKDRVKVTPLGQPITPPSPSG